MAKQAIWDALRDCKDAQHYAADINVVELGLVHEIRIAGDVLTLVMGVPPSRAPAARLLRQRLDFGASHLLAPRAGTPDAGPGGTAGGGAAGLGAGLEFQSLDAPGPAKAGAGINVRFMDQFGNCSACQTDRVISFIFPLPTLISNLHFCIMH
ncbi:MAG: DUF59 domain-containing protein, partial [Planctomycetales bacterium]|nr:DUF59 domain-containing protein [Planctomycetales bacterium]